MDPIGRYSWCVNNCIKNKNQRQIYTTPTTKHFLMSQSDYIRHKKNSSILKINTQSVDLAPILTHGDYVQYKQYTLANAIQNNKATKNQLKTTGKHRVFHIEHNVSHCPTNFVLCRQTHTRFNKQDNAENIMFRGYKRQNPQYEFYLKRKLKSEYPVAFSTYPDLKSCEVFEELERYFFLRDTRPYDEDNAEETEVFVG